MVNYYPLTPNNHKLPGPEPEPEEEQESPDPILVDFVVNSHEERGGKTIAVKASVRIPLNALVSRN
jgi:hypothetical protein